MVKAAFLIVAFFIAQCDSFITWVVPNQPLKGTPAPPGAPWPLPFQWINDTTINTIDPNNFNMNSNLDNCDIIATNLAAYREYIFNNTNGNKSPSASILTGLYLNVSGGCEGYIQFESDESYSIVINGDDAVTQISSKTVWGALRGLETFSQLVWQDDNKYFFVNYTEIYDQPRFSHRGILVDSSRHFIPKNTILQNLDAMQWNKFNVFHWHLSDDQSIPYESLIFPNLTQFGAYSPNHIYHRGDIQEIIEYARLRGIRVIPEFDSPGHTRAIGNAFKELITPCYGDGPDGGPYVPQYPNFSEMENLDPTNDNVYSFMHDLIAEVRQTFNDSYIHLGMDEVSYSCWKSNPNITEFMKANNWTEYRHLEEYYTQRLLFTLSDIDYKYITWQDPIDNNVTLASDILIHVWKDTSLDPAMDSWQSYIIPIAQKGYRMLFSPCWYLNYINYGADWRKFYECDPYDFEGTDEQKKLILGGEAAMWSEYVDGTNLLSRLWPRASAVGERLWSPENVKDTDSANFRLDQQRCRMLRRGISAEPILDGYCGEYEWGTSENVVPTSLPKPPSGNAQKIVLSPLLVFILILLNNKANIAHLFI